MIVFFFLAVDNRIHGSYMVFSYMLCAADSQQESMKDGRWVGLRHTMPTYTFSRPCRLARQDYANGRLLVIVAEFGVDSHEHQNRVRKTRIVKVANRAWC
jgi:hypothetical protein